LWTAQQTSAAMPGAPKAMQKHSRLPMSMFVMKAAFGPTCSTAKPVSLLAHYY
jgi:hypothetical protein